LCCFCTISRVGSFHSNYFQRGKFRVGIAHRNYFQGGPSPTLPTQCRRPWAYLYIFFMCFDVLYGLASYCAFLSRLPLFALSCRFKIRNHSSFFTNYLFNNARGCIFTQHVIFFLKASISFVLPDKPEWVVTSVAAVEYQAKKAWRLEVCKAYSSFN